MSTKETLPPWSWRPVEDRINYEALRSRLDAAEKELASVQTRVVIAEKSNDELVQKVISAQDLFDRAHEIAKAAEEELTKTKEANAELVKDRERLEGLLNLTNNEGNAGWQVTLNYDNYQDGALIINADGKVIAECYDIDLQPNEQFRKAIDAAVTKGTQ